MLYTSLYLSGLKFVQVFCGNGGEKLLVLAEGLVKKHVASHSLHEPEGIHCFFHYKPLPILNSTLSCFILFTNVLKAQSKKTLNVLNAWNLPQLSWSIFPYWNNKPNMGILWTFCLVNQDHFYWLKWISYAYRYFLKLSFLMLNDNQQLVFESKCLCTVNTFMSTRHSHLLSQLSV